LSGMKYRIAHYAEALHAALKDAPASKHKGIMRRFAALLSRHRMSGKSDLIAAAYEKIVLRESGTRKVKIESAAPASEGLKRAIREILGKKVFIEDHTNPELGAGIKILVDDELLIDASAKLHMEEMFQTKCGT